MKLRFSKAFRATRNGITPRRVAASKRFLRKQLDRFALFADEVAAEQPTPEERIANHDENWFLAQIDIRTSRAKMWWRARQLLRSLPERERVILVDAWNRSMMPGEPHNLLGHIEYYLADSEKRLAAGERWFVFKIADKMRVMLWDPPAAPAATRIAGPFEDYWDAIRAMEVESCKR